MMFLILFDIDITVIALSMPLRIQSAITFFLMLFIYIDHIYIILIYSSGLRGVVVTLDEDGHLQCSYLGTDPAMFTSPSSEVREIDYADQDRELSALQNIIKQKQQTTTGRLT